MNCRRHGSKPTIGLWMLIAIADVAILVAAAGVVTMLLIVAGLVALAGGVVAARALLHRSDGAGKTVARPRA
ncbi:hypothetical protein ODJ79_23465 [Actinoplanes sp. KI2]|uniref:hypothetical protein n=1 Tax=Actinoplanes sp. KI2 TaxID=2983315 RepID=UPI0021D5B80C|nr:hypothetical protein [Actinoplanes sp. KI2]MCU7726701.1 hypothetical protein [Actinoplanes sp. KI2]